MTEWQKTTCQIYAAGGQASWAAGCCFLCFVMSPLAVLALLMWLVAVGDRARAADGESAGWCGRRRHGRGQCDRRHHGWAVGWGERRSDGATGRRRGRGRGKRRTGRIRMVTGDGGAVDWRSMFDRLSDPSFPELDEYPEAQRGAVLDELELRSPAHTRSLWLLFGVIPFAVLLAVGNSLILRYNLSSLLALPLVLISAAVSVMPIWYSRCGEHVRSSSSRSAAVRTCRRPCEDCRATRTTRTGRCEAVGGLKRYAGGGGRRECGRDLSSRELHDLDAARVDCDGSDDELPRALA